MRVKSLLAALLLILACMQTMSAQGFRVYQNDGTEMQFYMSTDSIVFFEGASVGGNTGEVNSGPFTPLNQMIAGTWYYGKDKSITFQRNGRTDFFEGATFKFFPYQGTIIIYSVSGQPAFIFRVLDKTNRQMILNDESNGMYFLSKKAPEPSDEHEWVDLGLPSGTLWATCNVGASCPEEYGDYFAWGETSPKASYTLENYKFSQKVVYYADWDEEHKHPQEFWIMTKYNDNDHKTVLDRSDDAATANWGGDWRMPSKEQFKELFDNRYTITSSTLWNGVSGEKITSKINGECVFLPHTGNRFDSDDYIDFGDINIIAMEDIGSVSGTYWSSSLNVYYGPANEIIIPTMTEDGMELLDINRIGGGSVRPVRVN